MKISLKMKAILMIVMVGILIGIAAIAVYNRGIADLTKKEYEDRSMDIAEAIAQILDADQVKELRDDVLEIYDNEDEVVLSDQWGSPEFEEYISDFSKIENTDAFLSLREQLRKVQDVIDVDCLYILWFDGDQRRSVYLVDAAHEGACPPGCTDPFFSEDPSVVNNLDKGCPPNITHTDEYGYLVTTAMPIHTKDGEIVGFAAVDLSMNDIVSHEHQLLWTLILVLGIVIILVSLIGIFAVDRTIVRPINKLSKTAEVYTTTDLKFSEIDIHTGDEIETLADSMKQMECDIKEYYENLMATRIDLATAREESEEYKREANIDSLTNLRNKRAYDLAIADLEKNDSPYAIIMIDLNDLKGINDQYGHEKGDVAIRNLASLTCNVFKHSPVFRIGGDEFVVIMTNDDLKAREGLIGRFRDEIRKSSADDNLQAWEKISAACGCAVYDTQLDDGAASVFQRADEDMYEHKVRMKSTSIR